jgi:SAM-dependent methyltransferase
MRDAETSLARARCLLAEFAAQDSSEARVAEAIAADRGLSYQEAVDFRKEPLTYLPAVATLLALGALQPAGCLRFLHLGACHGVLCRVLQGIPGVALATALDLSEAALRHGRSWGLRAALRADAVTLAACRRQSFDAVLAESLYVPGYWRPAAIARSLQATGRVLRPGGVLLIQEWGFDVARHLAPELVEAGFTEVQRIGAEAPTQQGEREVTCFAFRCGSGGSSVTV